MRTLENLPGDTKFENFAQTWCKKCGAGDSVILVSSGRYARVSRVLGEGGPFLDEETQFSDTEDIYKCEECGAESLEEDELVTDNIWIAGEAYNAYHRIPPKPAEPDSEEEENYYDNEETGRDL